MSCPCRNRQVLLVPRVDTKRPYIRVGEGREIRTKASWLDRWALKDRKNVPASFLEPQVMLVAAPSASASAAPSQINWKAVATELRLIADAIEKSAVAYTAGQDDRAGRGRRSASSSVRA